MAWIWLATFLVAALSDYVVARWLQAVHSDRRLAASLYSAACSLLSSSWFLACCAHPSATVPAAAGHALGTWLAMTWGRSVSHPPVAPRPTRQ